MRSNRQRVRAAVAFACSVQLLVIVASYRVTDGCFCAIEGARSAGALSPALIWVVRIGGLPISLLPIRFYDPAPLAHAIGWLPIGFPDWLFLAVALLTNLQLWIIGLLTATSALAYLRAKFVARPPASRPAA